MLTQNNPPCSVTCCCSSSLCLQECFLMTAMNLIPQIASLMYNASTTLIRFLYVRSSLQTNIQEVYRRNQFTLMFVAMGEGTNIFNFVSAIYYTYYREVSLIGDFDIDK